MTYLIEFPVRHSTLNPYIGIWNLQLPNEVISTKHYLNFETLTLNFMYQRVLKIQPGMFESKL
jgi:hypothetical protein